MTLLHYNTIIDSQGLGYLGSCRIFTAHGSEGVVPLATEHVIALHSFILTHHNQTHRLYIGGTRGNLGIHGDLV